MTPTKEQIHECNIPGCPYPYGDDRCVASGCRAMKQEQIEAVLRDATARPWDVACDSYGKVQHSRKAFVFANTKGENGDLLVTIAGRILSWQDAQLIVEAVNSYEAHREALKRCYEWLCTEEAQKSAYHRETKRQVEAALQY